MYRQWSIPNTPDSAHTVLDRTRDTEDSQEDCDTQEDGHLRRSIYVSRVFLLQAAGRAGCLLPLKNSIRTELPIYAKHLTYLPQNVTLKTMIKGADPTLI